MENKKDRENLSGKDQKGAALVTVILISLLLGTACIAMLSAVGASSKNNSDALAEAKTYYAAESGLQAAIKVLRFEPGMTYSQAIANPTLSNWVTYSNGRVGVGSDTSYSLSVSDPDNSAGSITYSTVGTFEQADGTYAPTRVLGSGANTLTISFNPQPTTTATHPIVVTPFGSFGIIKPAGSNATINVPVKFRVDYVMTEPRAATRTIRGTIAASSGAVNFLTGPYTLMGSTITLCDSSCSGQPLIAVPPPTTALQSSPPFYGKMTPLEPYRLKVIATGYGPNSATKQLEAIIQKNFFNDLGSSAAIAMIGPNALFQVGTSAQMQIDGRTNPSVTVSDAAGLATVNGVHTNGSMLPPPEIIGADAPDWQRSPAAMDALVQQLKLSAQNSGRYFDSTHAPSDFGNFSAGTGITFCDRSCDLGGNTSGGGILVVTGTLTTSGNPRFNGLVLAIGQYVSPSNPGGVVRSGGGNEIFTGNIVIAPYNPNNLAAGWGQPRYDQSGGPGDTINSQVALDHAFDGTSSITNFMLGVAEK